MRQAWDRIRRILHRIRRRRIAGRLRQNIRSRKPSSGHELEKHAPIPQQAPRSIGNRLSLSVHHRIDQSDADK